MKKTTQTMLPNQKKAAAKKNESGTKADRAKAKKIAETTEEKLARLADQEAITPQHAALDAKLLKKNGIDPTTLTGAMIHRAAEIQREKINKTMARAKAFNEAHAPKLPADIIPAPSRIAQDEPAKEKGTKTPKEKKPAVKHEVPVRTKIFGLAATAILRWMGKTGGWTPEQGLKALTNLGADLALATCKIQIKAGAKGERGEPATLTKKQIAELKAAR